MTPILFEESAIPNFRCSIWRAQCPNSTLSKQINLASNLLVVGDRAIKGHRPMEVHPIRSDKDHRAALAEIDACWGASEGTEAGDRLDILLALVDIYEAKRWPVDIDNNFDPIDVLTYAIEELGHTRRN